MTPVFYFIYFAQSAHDKKICACAIWYHMWLKHSFWFVPSTGTFMFCWQCDSRSKKDINISLWARNYKIYFSKNDDHPRQHCSRRQENIPSSKHCSHIDDSKSDKMAAMLTKLFFQFFPYSSLPLPTWRVQPTISLRCPYSTAPPDWSAVSIWYKNWSAIQPLINSSFDNTLSLLISILLKISLVRFSGESSSVDSVRALPTML